MGINSVAAAGVLKPKRRLLHVDGLPRLARTASPVRFTANEAVSQPFELFLEVALSEDALAGASTLAAACLNRPIGIEITTAGVSRWFHGEIAGVHLNHVGDSDAPPLVFLELRPALWRLNRTVDTRLFAGKTAQQIINAILDEHELAGQYSWRVGGGHTFKVRPHCWQYRESCFQFVTRLLEEEGFHYWFKFARTSHQLMLSNGPEEIAACADPLCMGATDWQDKGDKPCVSFLRQSWRPVPAGYTVQGRSMIDPQTVVAGCSADAGAKLPPGANGKIHEADPMVDEITDGRTTARRRFEGYAAQAGRVEGSSNVCQLAAGRFVQIDTQRPKPGLRGVKAKDGSRFRLIAIHHDADQTTGRYNNRFDAVPADAPFTPALRTPRPTIAGQAMAQVVDGPDEHSRFRLKFELDRTDTTSEWVPLDHPPDILFLPRQGERVVVSFEEGNPDRPQIQQRLDTAATLPFDPATNSLLGGITTPAHKFWLNSSDEVKWALLEIAGRLHEIIQGDRVSEIDRDLHEHIKGDRISEVGKDLFEQIKGDRLSVIAKDLIEQISGNVQCSVDGSWTGQVGKQFGLQARELVFRATDRIILVVGGNYIVIDKQGVTINGKPVVHLNPPGGSAPGGPAAPVKPQRQLQRQEKPKPKPSKPKR